MYLIRFHAEFSFLSIWPLLFENSSGLYIAHNMTYKFTFLRELQNFNTL